MGNNESDIDNHLISRQTPAIENSSNVSHHIEHKFESSNKTSDLHFSDDIKKSDDLILSKREHLDTKTAEQPLNAIDRKIIPNTRKICNEQRPMSDGKFIHPCEIQILESDDCETKEYKKRLLTIDEMMTRYEKVQKIGKGVSSNVYKAVDIKTNIFVAVKEITLYKNETPHADEQKNIDQDRYLKGWKEITFLRRLDHPNIIKLKDVISLPSINRRNAIWYLILEYADSNLDTYIRRERNNNFNGSPKLQRLGLVKGVKKIPVIPNLLIKSYLYQLLAGIDHIHKHQIIHADIKPQNLLINISGDIKIGDFSHSIDVSPYSSHGPNILPKEVVTLWYRAPEIILDSGNYNSSIDIWSIGCIFAEMVLGEPLFKFSSSDRLMDSQKIDNSNDLMVKIFSYLGIPDEKTWIGVTQLPAYKDVLKYSLLHPEIPVGDNQSLKKVLRNLGKDGLDLIQKMLCYDPKKRITAAAALKHPYFDEILKLHSSYQICDTEILTVPPN